VVIFIKGEASFNLFPFSFLFSANLMSHLQLGRIAFTEIFLYKTRTFRYEILVEIYHIKNFSFSIPLCNLRRPEFITFFPEYGHLEYRCLVLISLSPPPPCQWRLMLKRQILWQENKLIQVFANPKYSFVSKPPTALLHAPFLTHI